MFKKLSDRNRFALIMIASSIGLTLIFGLIMGAFKIEGRTYLERVIKASYISFLWFFAPFVTTALLTWITRLEENFCFYFGIGLYYGTTVGGSLISDYLRIDFEASMILCFVISVLICYIYWLKHKNE